MADVAKAAGISTALVSIVMRGVPGASDATRARVLRIADELGYVPDERARKLRQSRSRVLGGAFELQQPFPGGPRRALRPGGRLPRVRHRALRRPPPPRRADRGGGAAARAVRGG